MEKKVAIFHWGEISIHACYLAKQLSKENILIDFFLYTPTYANKAPHLKTIIKNLGQTVNLIEIKCTYLETYIIKIHRLIAFAGPYLPVLFTNPALPFRTKKKFRSKNYCHIITITQPSLYWLFRTDASALQKTLHYSLEIAKVTDPNLIGCGLEHAIINEETKLLKKVKGLIIQDELRANAFLGYTDLISKLMLFYIPVSIPGNIIVSKNNFLHKKFNINNEKKIILYFGAVFQERKIDEMVKAFEKMSDERFILVVHGSGNFSHISNSDKIKKSNQLLPYEDLHMIFSSATIGLAFYDNDWPNTRLTAFSSEKIARYLQAGVPFVALKNESYIKLQTDFNCCVLIDDFDELQNAFNIIMNDYDSYRNKCYNAYKKYYNIEQTIKPLANYLAKNIFSVGTPDFKEVV